MLLLAALAWLGGCASVVRSEFTVYQHWPSADAPRTFRFVRGEAERDSLEHAAYEQRARIELAKAGFTEAPDGRYELGFQFTVRQRLGNVVEPGPAASPWVTYGWPVAYFGWGYGTGGYGWGWGAVPGAGFYDQSVYRRTLRLRINDRTATPPGRVYEVTSVSEGLKPDTLDVFQVMLRQLLEDFPGPSDVPRRAETPLDPKR